jgi:hypothetical protein
MTSGRIRMLKTKAEALDKFTAALLSVGVAVRSRFGFANMLARSQDFLRVCRTDFQVFGDCDSLSTVIARRKGGAQSID